jgi:type II secretory pathway pseudopilin PulG
MTATTQRRRASDRNWDSPVFVIVLALGAIAVFKFAEISSRRADVKVQEARDAAAAAESEATSAKSEAAAAQREVKIVQVKATQAMDRLIGSYESGKEIEVTPSKNAANSGFVYLGICDSGAWTKAYFSDLPACADGPVGDPVQIKSLRDMKVRAVAPSESGAGKTIDRIRSGRTFKILSMATMSPASHGPQIVWGEIDLNGAAGKTPGLVTPHGRARKPVGSALIR